MRTFAPAKAKISFQSFRTGTKDNYLLMMYLWQWPAGSKVRKETQNEENVNKNG